MAKIGWYEIEETFGEEIDMLVHDRRTGEFTAIRCASFEDYDRIIRFLDENRQVGALEQISSAA